MSWTQAEAAASSGGSSSSAIHDLFLEALEERDARGRVLDFGAGLGALSARLVTTARFTSVTAIDLVVYPGRSAAGIRWVRADLNRSLAIRDGAFDVIVAAEVIEHLENPRALAREWARVLRPGGLLLLSTPNQESLRSLLSLTVRGHHVAFTGTSYPAHITALVREDLRRVLCEAGFATPEFRFSARGAVPGLTRLDWGRLSGGLLRGPRFSDNVLAITRKL